MVATSRERCVFAAVTGLLLLGVWLPIWSNEFPPLQDYPYHLAQVAILVAGDAAVSSYAAHFDTDLGARPFAAFYLVAGALAHVVPLEVAGRIALSVPGVLWALLLCGGLRRTAGPPWGALVLLPLSLGLSHFLGFVTYLWSIPLLGLALEEQARLADGERGSAARQGIWVVGLFLTHPFTFLAFLALAALRLVVDAPLPGGRRRVAIAWMLAAAVFAFWFVAVRAGGGASGAQGVVWLPLSRSLELATLPFVGMRGGGEVAWSSLALWLAIGAVLVSAAIGHPTHASRRRFWVSAATACCVVVFAAPFRMGDYSYINARVPEIVFLCLGMAAGSLRIVGIARIALVAGVAAALLASGVQQRRVATELAEVAPLLERVPPGVSLLPLVFDDDSRELEPSVFDPHRHVHHYFHVRRGGGVTPYFFPHPLVPVQYRDGSPPPAPPLSQPGAYHVDRHAGYDHLLVRAAPARFVRRVGRVADEVATSGPWRLFVRRDAASANELEQSPAGDG